MYIGHTWHWKHHFASASCQMLTHSTTRPHTSRQLRTPHVLARSHELTDSVCTQTRTHEQNYFLCNKKLFMQSFNTLTSFRTLSEEYSSLSLSAILGKWSNMETLAPKLASHFGVFIWSPVISSSISINSPALYYGNGNMCRILRLKWFVSLI